MSWGRVGEGASPSITTSNYDCDNDKDCVVDCDGFAVDVEGDVPVDVDRFRWRSRHDDDFDDFTSIKPLSHADGVGGFW